MAYLRVEDAHATYKYIHADGFYYKIYVSDANESHTLGIYQPDNTEVLRIAPEQSESPGFHPMRTAGQHEGTVIENTPHRVVVRAKGLGFYNDAGTAYYKAVSAGDDPYIITYYFYLDRVVIDFQWYTEAQYDLTSGEYRLMVNCQTNNNELNRGINSSGVEKYHGEDGSGDPDLLSYDRTDYLGFGFEADEIYCMCYDLYHTDNDEFRQYFGPAGNVWSGLGDGDTTFPAGWHRIVTCISIDMPDRENDGGTFKTWLTSTAYVIGDIVGNDDLRYICHTGHNSSASDEPGTGASWTSYWHQYRETLADQYNDLVMVSPDTDGFEGIEVTDLVIPKDLSSDGFASDGARHFEMENDELGYTADRARIGHIDVIEDPPIQTGTVASPTDHLVGHWKMDDNAASTTIVATVGGNNGTLEGGDHTSAKDNADSMRGTSLLLNGTDDYINLNVACTSLISDLDKATLLIRFKPNFGTAPASNMCVFSFWEASNNRTELYFNGGGDEYYWNFRVDGQANVQEILYENELDSDERVQQWVDLLVSWDLDLRYVTLAYNGDIFHVDPLGTSWGVDTPTNFELGIDDGNSMWGAYYYDDVKVLDGAMLPYGAYFTGNGAVDTTVAHEDITFHLDFESGYTDLINSVAYNDIDASISRTSGAAILGSYGMDTGGDYGTAQDGIRYYSSDSVDLFPVSGSISLWFNYQYIGNNHTMFAMCRGLGDDTEFIDARIGTSGDDADYAHLIIRSYFGGNYETLTGDLNALTDGEWHHLRYCWKDADYVEFYLDGVLEERSDSPGYVGTRSNTSTSCLVLGSNADQNNGADVLIDQVYITSNPLTPQIPVILGSGPIHVPIQEIS